MPQNTDLILIDRLDNNLSEPETRQVDADISSDPSVATDWAFLKLAVDTISLGAIREKVAAARAAAKEETPVVSMEKREAAVVRSMFSKNIMRIAVAAVLILGASAVYKYSVVSNASIYNKGFSEFELGTSRGTDVPDNLDAAYRARNWNAVLSAFDAQAAKTNKSYFLAGMAQMELKNYPASVQHFETVLTNNSRNHSTYFQPESEYYVAMAYFMNNQGARGAEMIRRIKSNVYHPYYPLASKISATDLKIVDLKNK